MKEGISGSSGGSTSYVTSFSETLPTFLRCGRPAQHKTYGTADDISGFLRKTHVDASRPPHPSPPSLPSSSTHSAGPAQNQLQMLPFIASGGRVLVITESVDSVLAFFSRHHVAIRLIAGPTAAPAVIYA